MDYSNLGKKREPVQREQVVKDLLKMLATMPLADEEAEALYKTIAARVRNAVCSKCLKLKAKFEGEVRDNRFVCRECRFML